MPVTVMLQPELLEALGRTGLPTDVELRTRLAALLADRQTLPAPYVPMDPTAAVAAGLGDELTAQLRRGEDVIAEQLGPSSAERTIWSTLDGLDETTVAFLRDLGFRQLLVPAGAIDGEVAPSTGLDARPVSVRSAGSDRPLTVGADDEAFSRAFTAHAEPVREAYAWLAEVALMSIAADEAARRTGRRGRAARELGRRPRLPRHRAGRPAGQPPRPTGHRHPVLHRGAAGRGRRRAARGARPGAERTRGPHRLRRRPDEVAAGTGRLRFDGRADQLAAGRARPAAAGLPGAGPVATGPLGLPHRRRRAARRAPPVGRPGPGPHHHPRRTHDRAAHHPHQPGRRTVAGEGPAAQQQAGLPRGQRAPRHDHRWCRAGSGYRSRLGPAGRSPSPSTSSRRSATRSSLRARSSRCARRA